MKKIYTIAASLLLLAACSKDDSTGADHPLPAVEVANFNVSYSVYTYQDTLRIKPQVANEALYDYYWTTFSTNFVQGTGKIPTGDTIARSKDLDFEVLMNPGTYHLVFNVKHKATGVVKMLTANLAVATRTMNGWYLLKDDGVNTEFDFIHASGRINNFISYFNKGRTMEGKAVKAVFMPSHKTSLASTDLFGALLVLSEKDALICRVDNGLVVNSFDDMFFTKPETRKLQNAFQPMQTNFVTLINDNKVYSLNKGALFANFAPSTYKISSVAGVAAQDVGFDLNSKSVLCFNGANYAPLGTNAPELKNMNAEMTWVGGYAGGRSIVMALFRKADGSGSLMKLNGQYGFLAGFSSPLIMSQQTLTATHGLMQSSLVAGNYDGDYVYYVVGNSIYRTDVATAAETLQITIPAGETVTCMQHIKYPQPASASVVNTLNYMAIATYANGRYKVWLHNISSTGNIEPQTAPRFEGEGRVSNVTYMEQGMGSRTF